MEAGGRLEAQLVPSASLDKTPILSFHRTPL